jgi:hypothetical protein
MKTDWYVRAMLTVIAASLVYLGVLLTPLPPAAAQVPQPGTAIRPGEYTGPAEVVIVGWRLPEGGGLPVQLEGPAIVTVGNEVRVSGVVETLPLARASQRVVLVGWEDAAGADRPGAFRGWRAPDTGLPLTSTRP